ncbi:bifunctional glycosyltransferase family 2/GtrA family protein [Marinilactibacillus psychrotolerans]|nr:bifunctional glycosyltransferase family 2/GtrA family protein [Marinilactibacillus psychrotolerans]
MLNREVKLLPSTSKVIVVIPAYDPDHKLCELIDRLLYKAPTLSIVVVNDGSNEKATSIFKKIEAFPQCTVLTHETNLGKGKALKTAFTSIMSYSKKPLGIITVDADGQHKPNDIFQCIYAFLEQPHTLVLGARHFSRKDIPLRSLYGNYLTKIFLRVLYDIRLTDTQTGLRVIPYSSLAPLTKLPGNRYEYEMDMLMYFKKEEMQINEVPIATIYIDSNKSSHFNPLIDSIKIYSIFFKYGFSSLFSFLIDLSAFSLFLYFLRKTSLPSQIFFATIFARIISSLFNYFTNKIFVFSEKEAKNSMIKYFLLALVQMFISGFLVEFISTEINLGIPISIKILVDFILFIISFQIQRLWVFRKQVSKGENHHEK